MFSPSTGLAVKREKRKQGCDETEPLLISIKRGKQFGRKGGKKGVCPSPCGRGRSLPSLCDKRGKKNSDRRGRRGGEPIVLGRKRGKQWPFLPSARASAVGEKEKVL